MEESNNIQQNESAAQPQPEVRQKPNLVATIVGGDVLQSKWFLRQLPLIGLLALYGLALVGCRYRVEALMKGKIEAQDRINYLRETRIELQKRYQETIKISQIAEMLDDSDVGITAGPPFEI